MSNMLPSFSALDLPTEEESSKLAVPGKAKDKRPPAKYWINVGVTRGTEGNKKFLSLPMGIALDNLRPKDIPKPGHAPDATPEQIKKKNEFRAMRVAEAQLWEMLQAHMKALKPGETKKLALEVELRMCEEKEITEQADDGTNPFALGGDFKL